jgi:hypothetical protein
MGNETSHQYNEKPKCEYKHTVSVKNVLSSEDIFWRSKKCVNCDNYFVDVCLICNKYFDMLESKKCKNCSEPGVSLFYNF